MATLAQACRTPVDPSFGDEVATFVAALNGKDQVTRDHCLRVGALSAIVAEHIGLDSETVRDCRLAGILHDVGKLGVPDHILTKPARLDMEEYSRLQFHVNRSRDMVAASPAIRRVAEDVAAHHEHWDGNGYPYGLAGEQIPLIGRILAVCDAFDAMAFDRPYRPGLLLSKVRETLRDGAGTQWDPDIVAALLTVLDEDEPDTEPETWDEVTETAA